MTAAQILEELRPLGKESYRRTIMRNHGVPEPCFGVPISELKKIEKRIRKNYQLALDLFATGNYDAQYLAGLIADDARMTRADLRNWAGRAHGGSLAGATVAWVAAGSPHGWELAREWIDSPQTTVARCGWATLASLVAITPDERLDLPALRELLQRVRRTIRSAPDLVRVQMNGFLIAVGMYVVPLTDLVRELAAAIGPVTADLGANDCAIPYAPDYLDRAAARGPLGRKRKSAKC